MRIIGSIDEAAKIHDWVRYCEVSRGLPRVVVRKYAPRGWKYLSSGSYRSAWLSPSGVVYKVNHRKEAFGWDQSFFEIENLRQAWLRKLPKGCRIIRFGEYRVSGELIVAMEYVNGETVGKLLQAGVTTGHYFSLMRRMEDLFRLDDLHGDNAMVDDQNNLVVIDWGQ